MKHIENENKYKGLHVNKGVQGQETVNKNIINSLKLKRQKIQKASYYINGILASDRQILGRAITLIESKNSEHNQLAQEIIQACLPYSGKSIRIGITGVPGVGKSTFIEAFGKRLTTEGKKIAVLAIDPSSTRTKGSILGDKTRMEQLSVDANAFIRPSPSAGSLGGVAQKTREIVYLCEAAGFEYIFIETVGVGQSETAVHSMVDFFLLLMLAGAGDDLQGIKRGIMEMAHAIVINKAEKDNLIKSKQAKIHYENALHLFPPMEFDWKPKVDICSAYTGFGIANVENIIKTYIEKSKQTDFFEKKRIEQARYWMYETIDCNIKQRFYQNKTIQEMIKQKEKEIIYSKKSSFEAAFELLNKYNETSN